MNPPRALGTQGSPSAECDGSCQGPQHRPQAGPEPAQHILPPGWDCHPIGRFGSIAGKLLWRTQPFGRRLLQQERPQVVPQPAQGKLVNNLHA